MYRLNLRKSLGTTTFSSLSILELSFSIFFFFFWLPISAFMLIPPVSHTIPAFKGLLRFRAFSEDSLYHQSHQFWYYTPPKPSSNPPIPSHLLLYLSVFFQLCWKHPFPATLAFTSLFFFVLFPTFQQCFSTCFFPPF